MSSTTFFTFWAEIRELCWRLSIFLVQFLVHYFSGTTFLHFCIRVVESGDGFFWDLAFLLF